MSHVVAKNSFLLSRREAGMTGSVSTATSRSKALHAR